MAAPGSIVLDLNFIEEDATVPEQVAQEIIIKNGNITHIAAGPYNGFLQGSLQKNNTEIGSKIIK